MTGARSAANCGIVRGRSHAWPCRGGCGAAVGEEVEYVHTDGTLAQTLAALRVRIIEGTTSSWWQGYGYARSYHGQHGNLDVPVTCVTASGFRLGPGSAPSAPSATPARCPLTAPGTWMPSA